MRIVETQRAGAILRKFAERGNTGTAKVEAAVRRIVNAVRTNGDRALLRFAKQLDGLGAKQALRVSAEEMQQALRDTPTPVKSAMEEAAIAIRQFADWQRPQSWQRERAEGVRVGQLVRPLDSVGCYVPGGRYPLPSTVLMTVIPAQAAGVERIVVTSPNPPRETLAAAAMLGVEEFYRVGGAQAISAMAYGTNTLPKVQKIVGPGNLYVTAAKKMVAFDCAIDMLAGPTEVLIYSDSGPAEYIAADLVAQAEHDPETYAVFVTTKSALAKAVSAETKRQAKGNKIAEQSLKKNGVILLAKSREEAFDIANQIAPEHISVDPGGAEFIANAGSIFVGANSPQPIGDYCSGPNHVLPTGAAARWRGGLSVLDFVKIITVQELTPEGLKSLSDTATTLAAAEGLRAHAEAVQIRLGSARGRKAYA